MKKSVSPNLEKKTERERREFGTNDESQQKMMMSRVQIIGLVLGLLIIGGIIFGITYAIMASGHVGCNTFSPSRRIEDQNIGCERNCDCVNPNSRCVLSHPNANVQVRICCPSDMVQTFDGIEYCYNGNYGAPCFSDDMCNGQTGDNFCRTDTLGEMGMCGKSGTNEPCTDNSCRDPNDTCAWADAGTNAQRICTPSSCTCAGAEYARNLAVGSVCRCDCQCASDNCDGDAGIGLRGVCR